MKMLIVDDDINLMNIFKKWALIKGFNAEFAYNGLEALELVEKEKFDIILMDIDMPILDGITTAEKLQKITPQTKVLILTGLHPQHRKKLPHNIVDVLLKPISLSELSKKLSLITNPQNI